MVRNRCYRVHARGDQLGVTSIIRDLSLSPRCYEPLIHFFHSAAWDPNKIRQTWWKLLAERAPLYRVKNRCILIGDGVKQSKEAFYMAGVKKLLQESENSSKSKFIFGHMFGAVGVLIGRKGGKFCAPLQMDIQDGLRTVSSWDGSGISRTATLCRWSAAAVQHQRFLERHICCWTDTFFL